VLDPRTSSPPALPSIHRSHSGAPDGVSFPTKAASSCVVGFSKLVLVPNVITFPPVVLFDRPPTYTFIPSVITVLISSVVPGPSNHSSHCGTPEGSILAIYPADPLVAGFGKDVPANVRVVPVVVVLPTTYTNPLESVAIEDPLHPVTHQSTASRGVLLQIKVELAFP
jgi:hypothetical protein